MTHQELEIQVLKAIVSDACVSVSAAVARLDDSGVTGGDFKEGRSQALFAAIESDLRAGRQPEVVSLLKAVGKRVPRDMVLDVLEGEAAASVDQRLAVLREVAQRRVSSATLRTLADMFDAPRNSLADANAELTKAVQALSGKGALLKTAENTTHDLLNRLEEVQQGKRVPVLPTGIDALDFVISGFQPTLTIIGALPAVGKSALVATAIHNVASRGQKIGLLSLEDKADWLTTRLTSELANIPVPVLAFKPLTEGQMNRVGAAMQSLYLTLKNVVIDDRHGLTTAEVVASARRMVAMGCKAVVVDHLGEVRLERSERHDLDIADALSQLRGIAKTYGVPVVVLCHLRRREGLDGKSEPRLTDFAFSSAVERMARVALGLWRDQDQLAVTVLKQTNGPANITVCLDMNKASGTVRNTQPTQALRDFMRELHGDA